VAGYLILTQSFLFKFKQQRYDTQRLVFESVLIGVVISVITYIVRLIFQFAAPDVFKAVYNALPFKSPFFGTSLCTLAFAFILSKGGNLFLNKEKWVRKSIQSVGNELELIIEKAVADEILLLFTLDSDKFYIGWVKEFPIPSQSKYYRVLPALSGFRDEEKRLVFTTDYIRVYSEYIREMKVKDLRKIKSDIILPLDSIVSVSYFDPQMYSRFNQMDSEDTPE
jgi:hypothetical protein